MAQPPNLLFLFPDQWRGDWIGCAGNDIPVKTPNIDRLASYGTRFPNARTNSPLCAPARAALATGNCYPAAGVAGGHDDLARDTPTIFARLRDAGYSVATCGKNDLRKGAYMRSAPGAGDWLAALGFTQIREHAGKRDAAVMAIENRPDPYVQFLRENNAIDAYLGDIAARDILRTQERKVSAVAHRLPRTLYTDDFCGRNALGLIAALPRTTPWFLWVNFPGPHEPFDPPDELLKSYAGTRFPDPVAPDPADPSDHQAVRRAYAAMMEGIDQWIGRIIGAVAERGELDRTIVVFSSDHGEMLGDHGKWGKAVAQEGSLRIPLVIAGPGLRRGIVSPALAELADIGATLLDAAGIAPLEDAPENARARSLLPMLSGRVPETRHRSHQYAALGDWRAVMHEQYKAVRWADGRVALYDLAADPGELADVAAARPAIAGALGQWLAQYPGTVADGV
ncbi:MAG: sulfatase-like hydrolase/transferase [Dongiaceae bacterium]